MADEDPTASNTGPFSPAAIGFPVLYFNGFELNSSLSDMSATLALNGKAQVVLCMSFTTAKTFAQGLSAMVNEFETATDHLVMNMEDVRKGYDRTSSPKDG